MRTNILRTIGLSIAAAISISTIAGCSSPEEEVVNHVSGTRSQLYSSLEALKADSQLIVVGTPVSQEVVRDIDDNLDFTLSAFKVQESLNGTSEEVIIVRQTGSQKQGAPAKILEIDSKYMLYLKPSALPGAASSQFYVTGLTAGIYEASPTDQARATISPDTSFVQTDPDPGDTLPETISIADV